MKPESNQQNFKQTKDKKPCRMILWALILLLLILMSSCGLMYHLGRRAKDQAEPNKQTIRVEPETENETTLSIYGVVRYTNGAPCSNHTVELHSTPKTARTNQDGSFFFYNVEKGDHSISVLDDAGNVKASMDFHISDQADKNIQYVKISEVSQQIRFEIPINTILLDIDLELDEQASTLSFDANAVTAALTEGRVLTSLGSVQVKENEAVAFASGHYMLPDGTIFLANGGVLFPQQIYLPPEAVIDTLPSNVDADINGILHLTDKTEIDRTNRKITLPNGIILQPDLVVKMPDGSNLEIPDYGNNAYLIREKDSGLIGNGSAGSKNIGVISDMENGALEPSISESRQAPEGKSNSQESRSSSQTETLANAEQPNSAEDSTKSEDQKPSNVPTETETKANSGLSGGTGSSGGGSGSSGGGGTRPTEEPELVEIGDRKTGKLWKQLETIDLFSDPSGGQVYEMLYPGIEGQYDFYIRNTMKAVTYMTVTIEEEVNSENGGMLPLEYQILDGNGTPLSEDWKNTAELKAFPITLQPKENVNYSIRWRWSYEKKDVSGSSAEADAYDTKLGSSENLNHKLRLIIHIEQ